MLSTANYFVETLPRVPTHQHVRDTSAPGDRESNLIYLLSTKPVAVLHTGMRRDLSIWVYGHLKKEETERTFCKISNV